MSKYNGIPYYNENAICYMQQQGVNLTNIETTLYDLIYIKFESRPTKQSHLKVRI